MHHLLRHLLSAAWPQRSDQPCRSTEFQRDKNSAKISTDSSRCFGSVSYGLHGRLQSGCSNLTLPKCRSLSTSPWDLEGEPAVGEDLRYHRRTASRAHQSSPGTTTKLGSSPGTAIVPQPKCGPTNAGLIRMQWPI